MIKQTLALVGLTLSFSANAAIVDLGNITRDTDTGLDWLDVTETQGLSPAQVSSQMLAGGAYEGYRYATTAELDQLIINFGYVAINSGCSNGSLHCDIDVRGENEIIDLMINTLGDTGKVQYDNAFAQNPDFAVNNLTINPSGAGRTLGFHGPYKTNGYLTGTTIYDLDIVQRSTGLPIFNSRDSVRTDIPGFNHCPTCVDMGYGSFIVSPSAVPVPATAWLFGSALIGLVGIERKK